MHPPPQLQMLVPGQSESVAHWSAVQYGTERFPARRWQTTSGVQTLQAPGASACSAVHGSALSHRRRDRRCKHRMRRGAAQAPEDDTRRHCRRRSRCLRRLRQPPQLRQFRLRSSHPCPPRPHRPNHDCNRRRPAPRRSPRTTFVSGLQPADAEALRFHRPQRSHIRVPVQLQGRVGTEPAAVNLSGTFHRRHLSFMVDRRCDGDVDRTSGRQPRSGSPRRCTCSRPGGSRASAGFWRARWASARRATSGSRSSPDWLRPG